MNMHITFIQTGGTIDKDYPRSDDHHGYEFKIGQPAVKAILPFCHALFTYDIVEAIKKDSLDMTDKDRQKIADIVKKASSDKIVITHGTDTMARTAEAIQDAAKEKTVVLAGAMLPEKFANSDAKFNIGMAVAAVQAFPPGIYITLYGHAVPLERISRIARRIRNQIARSLPGKIQRHIAVTRYRSLFYLPL